MNAARNGVNQEAFSDGISCGSAYQTNSSWSSVGVARKNQTYTQIVDRTTAKRLPRPSASTKPRTVAAASEVTVSPSARSAPLAYVPEESAFQKRWVSNCTRRRGLLQTEVPERQVVLLGERPHPAVHLQRLELALDCGPDGRIAPPVVDAERVEMGVEVGDLEAPLGLGDP